MDGLVTAAGVAAHGATTHAPPPGLTFTYTPADIQGLAEPRNGGGGIQVAAQPHHHGHTVTGPSHMVQGRPGLPPQQVQVSSPRLHVGNTSGISMGGGGRTITSMPVTHTVNPYDTIEALIQQQERSHSQSQPPSAVPLRLPSTPDPPIKDRPRIRGRMTPYAFFVQHRREFYRQQGVPVQFTPFSKECSALWKTMTDEEKQKFQKLAEEDRERYRREVSGFDKPLAKDGTRRGRRKKEPGQPKRNMCAFLHFCSVKRPKLKQENPSLSVGAMARQLSSAWKLMTPEQKKPYDEMAARDKQRYEQQKQAYEAGYSAAFLRRDMSPTSIQQAGASGSGVGSGGVGQVALNPVMVARHRRRKKDPDMPRRNMSAFMFYSLENRPEVKAQNPDFGVGKLAQCLAEHWKVMNSTQKHPYDLMARKDKERYEQELKAYKKGLYTGTGLTPRQVAHSVTGRTIPPPASHGQRKPNSLSGISVSSGASTSAVGMGVVGDTKPGVLGSPSDDDGSPPSGDELDQLCEFYQ